MELDLTVRYLDTLAALGVRVPKAATDAAAIYSAALTAARRQPDDTLRLALEAGELTPENVADRVHAAATDLTAQQNALTLVRNLMLPLNRVIREALRDNRDRITTDLAATFKPAAEKVTEAGKHFGPDTKADHVIDRGPELIDLWRSLNAHTATLDKVSAAYRNLLADVLRELPDEPVSLFIANGKTLNLAHASALYRVNGGWLTLAHAGFKLRLNTPTEAAELVAAARVREDKAVEEHRKAQLVEHRRQHMPLGMR